MLENPKIWYTHFPNNPVVNGPDRTIDYLFSSRSLSIEKAYIRQHDTLDISDHLPVIGIYRYQHPFNLSVQIEN